MAKQSLGIIGLGAFGSFMLPHLEEHFDITVHDVDAAVRFANKAHNLKIADLADIATKDIIVIAIPVQRMQSMLCELERKLKERDLKLKTDTLVIDVASVKIKPTEMMKEILPPYVAIVGTHPLFGPQSGKNGIAGLNIAVCDVRGGRAECVTSFLRDKLQLNVFEVTPEDHDRQLAYVQGLTHLLAKVVVALDLPEFQLTTKTYDLMQQMTNMVRYDSDELFKAIERENPFTAEAKKAFFSAARNLEEQLEKR